MTLLSVMDAHLCSVLVLLVAWSTTHACPEFCYCFDDTFVTCSNFPMIDLAMLPYSTDTLTLSSGDIDELPKGFLAMARSLKLLEINKLRVRVVRQGAFRGLSNLEKLSITDSTFDIVEPESFSAMSSVQEFEIISSQFGRIGKHAFSSMKNIRKFTVWLTSFGTLADEAFYRMQGIESFQISTSNISYVGKDIFKGSKGVEEATIYNNHIDSMAESSLVDLFANAKTVSVHKNTFACSCDLSWILKKPELLNNFCVYPGQIFTVAERRFQLRSMTADALCTATQEEGTSTGASTNNIHIPSGEDIDYENRQTEVAQHSQEIGKDAQGNASDTHIFPVVETFDEDLAGIDHFLFEDVLSPTSADQNKTSLETFDESSLEDQSILPDITKLVKDKISVFGRVQSIENTSQSVQDIEGKNSKEIFLVGKEGFALDKPDHLFDATDSSTEDERSETFNIVGEYVEVTLAPTVQNVDLPLPTEHELMPPPRHNAHIHPENLTTDNTVVTWEQESVYFDQKTPLSSSENEGFESELTDSYTDEHVDVDMDNEEEGEDVDEDTNESATRSIMIDKMALAISGRVNGQGQQKIHSLPKDTHTKRANCQTVYRASLLCVLASCLFCILHWLVLV